MERRLENVARVAMQAVTGLTTASVDIRVRDEDEPLRQLTAADKPKIVLTAEDRGRYPQNLQQSPIRLIELKIVTKVSQQKLDAAEFRALIGIVEEWLDNTNLITQLTDAATGIYTKVAVRQPGTAFNINGSIREQTISILCKSIPAERTT